ncbi:hypothetical protein O4H52_09845 [Sphingomonadaceae bacterium G21617-S1]|jgi:hypothetical protein|uniref:hypothetical protein n=1 Tax=Rhizorhabdus sp. TaxID=1968843 RepID=UPI00120A4F4E|nr:hypothetical protein [Rhizorhabdus sp.]MBD3762064.1 hypothetical protein [Rhizorhabdus sp.]MCZ4341907.1 hypothetical protein [Sphingomonadaceae bacterium G21617-S1]TAK07684.1 MAG: hypothetical protein EPO38_12405 [Rhizorhabdus sp.]
MSRAINLNASVEQVTDICAKHSAGISTIEALLSGGTRVVLLNSHDAAVINRVCAKQVMSGTVKRTPLRMRSQE